MPATKKPATKPTAPAAEDEDEDDLEEMTAAEVLCWRVWCQLLNGNADKLQVVNAAHLCYFGNPLIQFALWAGGPLYHLYIEGDDEGDKELAAVLMDGPKDQKRPKVQVLGRFPYSDPNKPLEQFLKAEFGLVLLEKHAPKDLPPGKKAPKL